MADENKNTALSPGHLLSEERVLRISPSFASKINNLPTCKIKMFDKTLRFATWNVRSLYMAGKLDNVESEMTRLGIDILGMSEVRWPDSGKQRTKTGYMYYSGGTDQNHRYGTAVIIKDDLARTVTDFVPLCDRVMLIKLQTSYRTLNIIQAYAPTMDKSDDEVEQFYNNLDEVLHLTKKGEMTIVMGDFNAKVGVGSDGNSVGKYGLGERNSRGDRLIQFCTENDLLITNTFFKLHPRRLYTWRSPADNKNRITRNQIDFILIKREISKYVKSVKTYPGADVNSDHNPVVMDFRFKRLINTARKKIQVKAIDMEKIRDPQITRQIGVQIENKFKEITPHITSIEETWYEIKDTLTNIQEQTLGVKTNRKKKEWMTTEILTLMDKRRACKRLPDQYRDLNRIIRRKCRDAKEQWMSERCSEIELLQAKHDTFNLHKKVKELTNRNRKHPTTVLRNANNEIIMGIEAKLRRWKDYVEELYNDDRPEEPPSTNDAMNETGPPITKSEIIHAIRAQKNKKATGPDNIHVELIKIIAEQEGAGLDILTSLFNAIYNSGQIPTDWLESTFITIPKKSNSSHCDDYRMISLMSHVLKIFLRIIHTRIYRKCDSQVDDTQFGFRNGFGTREALFALNVLTQRCRDVNVNVFACFIDYRKAFDCVKHAKMIEILCASGVDRQEINIISGLYWHQTSKVKIEQSLSEDASIKRGVRQGCILSPLLFNLYSEAVFKDALAQITTGIKVNGTMINNLRYADDTVIVADNLPDLQSMMNLIVHRSEQFGLHINTAKTKLVVFSKSHIDANLIINGQRIQQVLSFKYLGTIINSQCNPKTEIRSRIEQARGTFMNMKNLFTRSDLSLELRVRMIRCYVFSVLLYGCEGWTLDPSTEKRLEAFEMYVYRRILRISWVDRVTNAEVLRRMSKSTELLFTIKERKTNYIGHIMRGAKYDLLRLILEGKIQGRRSVGRRQNSWLKDIRRWFNCSSIDIFRAAVSRTMLAIWIANLRQETAS